MEVWFKKIRLKISRIWLYNRHEEQSERQTKRVKETLPLCFSITSSAVCKPGRIRDGQRDRQYTQENKHQHRQSTENTDILKYGKNVGGGKTSI